MARQKLGQHFLASSKVLDRITKALQAGAPEPDALAIEIGPGKGALTEYLLRSFGRVIALELDRDLVQELRSRWDENNGLQVVEGNALRSDWSQWGGGVLAGNLPYYLATPLISHFLRTPGNLRHAVFLIQREVAERITAKPGTRDYGYFSVECQFLSRVEYLFTVPPGAFHPPPKVESAVIRVTPNPMDTGVDVDSFLTFVSLCFQHKRKTLRNNLTGVYQTEGLVELGKRAEQLTVAELARLHGSLARRSESMPSISSQADGCNAAREKPDS